MELLGIFFSSGWIHTRCQGEASLRVAVSQPAGRLPDCAALITDLIMWPAADADQVFIVCFETEDRNIVLWQWREATHNSTPSLLGLFTPHQHRPNASLPDSLQIYIKLTLCEHSVTMWSEDLFTVTNNLVTQLLFNFAHPTETVTHLLRLFVVRPTSGHTTN